MKGRILVVGGSDSGGGAGIQADLKSVMALGGYAGTAITVLTAQDTTQVSKIESVSAEMVAQQMSMMFDDIGVDCIKTGMLYSRNIIAAVSAMLLEKARNIPMVLDPVLVATSGSVLLEKSARQALTEQLFHQSILVTPNVPEAETLTGVRILSFDDMVTAGRGMLGLGAPSVLIKGGHMKGDLIRDVLVTANGVKIFDSDRIDNPNTHGTGCTLSSAITSFYSCGKTLKKSCELATKYVHNSIRSNLNYGKGHGPINHLSTIIIDKKFKL